MEEIDVRWMLDIGGEMVVKETGAGWKQVLSRVITRRRKWKGWEIGDDAIGALFAEVGQSREWEGH